MPRRRCYRTTIKICGPWLRRSYIRYGRDSNNWSRIYSYYYYPKIRMTIAIFICGEIFFISPEIFESWIDEPLPGTPEIYKIREN